MGDFFNYGRPGQTRHGKRAVFSGVLSTYGKSGSVADEISASPEN